jgi:hypothetical protein
MDKETEVTQGWFLRELKEGRSYRLNVLYACTELLCIPYATNRCWNSFSRSWPLLGLPVLFAWTWRGLHGVRKLIDNLEVDSVAKEKLLTGLFSAFSFIPLLTLLVVTLR